MVNACTLHFEYSQKILNNESLLLFGYIMTPRAYAAFVNNETHSPADTH